ncbi:MAG: hypothetical protein PHO19_02395 [Candidatus Pacebacteria bacterium]|jgi:hypothetical protein|nr:hypothetical protein [Candidatus Paceibacterota bacterium]
MPRAKEAAKAKDSTLPGPLKNNKIEERAELDKNKKKAVLMSSFLLKTFAEKKKTSARALKKKNESSPSVLPKKLWVTFLEKAREKRESRRKTTISFPLNPPFKTTSLDFGDSLIWKSKSERTKTINSAFPAIDTGTKKEKARRKTKRKKRYLGNWLTILMLLC